MMEGVFGRRGVWVDNMNRSTSVCVCVCVCVCVRTFVCPKTACN